MQDRIEKRILLRAPRQRVWRALTDREQFGAWFGMRVDEPFKAGATVKATIRGTTVDPEIAKKQREFEGVTFDMVVERIDPETLFSFRWHPGGSERGVDYSKEPMTLVEFALADAPGGILLTVTESGFDKLPLARRAKAFADNEQGWELVTTLVEKFLAKAA